MTSAWDEYVEALRTLERAPAAGATRRRRIDDDADGARGAADDRLRRSVAARQELEDHLARTRTAVDQAFHDHAIAADGPATKVDVPEPTSIASARNGLARVERQLADDTAALAAAREHAAAAAERARQWRRKVGIVAAIALLVLVVLIAVIV
ncbi:MAG: hypothetical protein GEV10_17990 [Streptosporangiales bacterium]|nr:hypothetical protein [Streptosporangiales bacterium]